MSRDLYVLDDENNPNTSRADIVYPRTILDQVYDDLSPTKENLREIIANLHQEILTGGKGNIVFPVTSVNGQTDDVVIDKLSVGLGRVDNTRDVDKPLSVPQREAMMDILKSYDFNINLEDLYAHHNDTSNPHNVSVEQIDVAGDLTKMVDGEIGKHNLSTLSNIHPDIRMSLTRLWSRVDDIDENIDFHLDTVMQQLADHQDSDTAHHNLFDQKEDVSKKAKVFTEDTTNQIMYPTTEAVVNVIAAKIHEFNETLPDIKSWIDDINVVDTRADVPQANPRYAKQAYFIRNGATSQAEIAICRLRSDNINYYWDYSQLGSYSRFNREHFIDSADGLSLNMGSIINTIMSEHGLLDNSLAEILSGYYRKEEIDNFNYINHIQFLAGTMSGTIRFYVNHNRDTMSTDIPVAGLQRLAYLEYVTESELADNAVRERHIIDDAIASRHIQAGAVRPESVNCPYGCIIGNTQNMDMPFGNIIPLSELADWIRPLIGGWPDPNLPGDNPWNTALQGNTIHPHQLANNVVQELDDGSMVQRFTSTISVVANMNMSHMLSGSITADKYRIINAGGSWVIQSDPVEWSVLGGSNLTGHTFGTIRLTNKGLYFDSISIGDRYEAPIDLWVQYVPIETSTTDTGD